MTDSWLDVRRMNAEKYAKVNGVNDETGAVMYQLTEIDGLSSYDVFRVCRVLMDATCSPDALSGMVNEIVEAWET